jgi:general stress protein YciG
VVQGDKGMSVADEKEDEEAAPPSTPRPKRRKGFAAMSPEKQRAIASKGGKRAHELGHAHRFTSEEASAAGKKGGAAVSRDVEHMREIGAKGHSGKGGGDK